MSFYCIQPDLPAAVVDERVAVIHAVRENSGGDVLICKVLVIPVDRPRTETCKPKTHITQGDYWRVESYNVLTDCCSNRIPL